MMLNDGGADLKIAAAASRVAATDAYNYAAQRIYKHMVALVSPGKQIHNFFTEESSSWFSVGKFNYLEKQTC